MRMRMRKRKRKRMRKRMQYDVSALHCNSMYRRCTTQCSAAQHARIHLPSR
jgi:hypothetical protein